MLKNKIIGVGMAMFCIMMNAKAEVLVILPESGPMARAGLSIKQGFVGAYQTAKKPYELKFVNSDEQNIQALLNTHLTENTQLVVGPLSRVALEAIIQMDFKIPVLALNHIEQQNPMVVQFSLAKQQDAQAILHSMQQDQVRFLSIVHQTGREQEHQLFLNALLQQSGFMHENLEIIPSELKPQQGLLLLGDAAWLQSQMNLPKQRVYTVSNAIALPIPIAQGVQFCDVPALYSQTWPEIQHEIRQAKTEVAFQRLIAFGGDAWQISSYLLENPQVQKNNALQFKGRTGQVHLQAHKIQRTPACYQQNHQLEQKR